MTNSTTTIHLRDQNYGSSARIAPQLGFNCYSFQVPVPGGLVEALNTEAEFESGGKKGTRSGIPILFPFPNRIQHGQYTWNGNSYQLPVTDGNGNAIHGFVVDRPWRVITADSQTAIAEFQLSVDAPDRLNLWPADFLIEVAYHLRQQRLRCDIRIVNAGDQALPWGFGTHPYFNVPIQPGNATEECLIRVGASEAWELNTFIPTGRRLPVDPRTDLRSGIHLDRKLDDVLTSLGVENGKISCEIIDQRLGYQIVQTADSIFRECVVFTPPNRACICLEPYTCTTNAINLQQQGVDAGLRVLAPGQQQKTWFEISIEPV